MSKKSSGIKQKKAHRPQAKRATDKTILMIRPNDTADYLVTSLENLPDTILEGLNIWDLQDLSEITILRITDKQGGPVLGTAEYCANEWVKPIKLSLRERLP